MSSILIDELNQAIEKAQNYLRGEQAENGSWHGWAIAGPDATAEMLICQRFLGVLPPSDAAKALKWLLKQQFTDGSFPAYTGADQGSIDETCICYAALLSAGVAPTEPSADKAYRWIQSHGGFLVTTPYTQVLLACAGVLDPEFLPNMPFESVLIPGIERVIGSRFTPVYTIFSLALPVMVAEFKARVQEPPQPKRALLQAAHRRMIDYWTEHQNPSGNCFGAINVTIMMLISLKLSGLAQTDSRFQRGISDLQQWRIETADELSYMLYNSTLWNTALVMGVFRLGNIPSTDPALVKAANFIVSEQSLIQLPADWQNPGCHSPRTGGFAFEDNNPLGADSDSTSVALWGLGHLEPKSSSIANAIDKGLAWLWGMQNKCGGWSGFSHGQPDKPPGPFSIAAVAMPMDPLGGLKLLLKVPPAFSEPALEDITGRVLQGLGRLGFTVSDPRIAKAVSFIDSQRYINGVWWGRWETNYLAGSAEVLSGLAAVGADLSSSSVANAIEWVKQHQNIDGGFGESVESYNNLAMAGIGETSSYLTGIVTNALIQCDQAESPEVEKAIRWCIDNQNEDGSWPEGNYQFTVQWPWPFYRLTLVPTIYPLRALTAYRRARYA